MHERLARCQTIAYYARMEKRRARHLEGTTELVNALTQRMIEYGIIETSLTVSAYEPWPAEGDVFVLHAADVPPLFGWVRSVRSLQRDATAKTETIQITLGRRLRTLSPLLLPGGRAA